MAETAYVALGSNLEHPERHLHRAVNDIDSVPHMAVSACSRLYRSDPVGPPGQPDYCNAVVAVNTTLEPLPFLNALQSIENSHGRIRTVRWGPRTLDLDIILFGSQTIESERLIIPHCQMHVRNFVLCPLMDVAPYLELPDGQQLKAMVEKLGHKGLKVIAECYPWIETVNQAPG